MIYLKGIVESSFRNSITCLSMRYATNLVLVLDLPKTLSLHSGKPVNGLMFARSIPKQTAV